jgi:hypothetical protein
VRRGTAAVLGATVVALLSLVPVVPLVTGTSGGAVAGAAGRGVSAYWLVASDGGIFSFGGAGFYGSTGGMRLNKPIVGMAGTADSGGYWLDASDGGIFAFGDAGFYGSMGGMPLNQPVVGMAAVPDGGGYWMVAADGGIFAFGDAGFYGSTGAMHLNRPVVGMASTPDGRGYWLVAADGGIFAFGDAGFYGSTGAIHLNQPITGMTANPNGQGYWFVAADGGVFAFGDAPFYGSLGNVPQSRPIVAMAADAGGDGYWFTNNNGAVSNFGGAGYWGSAPQVLNRPVVGMAEVDASGSFTGSSYPSGTFGYDISNFQCGNLPPAPHVIGIVEVEGYSMAASANACLGAEAAWAGAGLNLYVFLTYGETGSSGDQRCLSEENPDACNFGYETGLDAFQKAQNAGVNTQVPWWLDVESGPSWSGDLAANASMIQGVVDALQYGEGINSVGIYASPGVWSGIVGNWSPSLPYWAADWQVDPTATCTNLHSKYSILPSGPLQIVQYSSPSAPLPLGGMDTAFDNDYAC